MAQLEPRLGIEAKYVRIAAVWNVLPAPRLVSELLMEALAVSELTTTPCGRAEHQTNNRLTMSASIDSAHCTFQNRAQGGASSRATVPRRSAW